jgi:type I restriction enzyme S subunit
MKWYRPSIGKVAQINPRKPRLQIKDDDPVSFVPMAAVSETSAKIEDRQNKPFVEVCKGFTYFEENDVLFAKITPCMENGKAAMAKDLLDGFGFGSTEFHVLRANKEVLEAGYLLYFIRQENFRRQARQSMTGAVGQQRVPKDFIEKHEIPLPPPSEQRRIVEILDQADRLRKLRAEADKKAERILPALFIKMFGDPIQNLMNGRWPLKRFDSFSKVSYGLADRLDSSLGPEDGLRIITISNVNLDGSIDESVEKYSPADKKQISKASIQEHDLLFNWRNGSKEHVGKTAIWENNWGGETLHVSFLLKIRADQQQASPYYLWSLLNLLRASGFFVGQSRMQVNSKFNASELSALKVPLPPKEQQENFEVYIKKLRNLSKTFESRNSQIEKLFNALLHRAFTGDLTAAWRQGHMKELLQEMELQVKALNN